jgi:hypothetical protein
MLKSVFGKLAVGALVLAALFGGAVAASAQGTHPGQTVARPTLAATGANKPRLATVAQFLNGEMALVAKTIGISTADLKTALKGGQTPAQVAQAHKVDPQTVITTVVKDITTKAQARAGWSKLTSAQQTQFTTKLQTAVTNFVNNGVRANGRGANGRGRVQKAVGFRQDEVAVAAKTIGITPADLKTAIKGGQTVAQVAAAHMVDASTVISAVVTDITTKAQARPGWAKLTSAQQTQFTTKAQERVTAWVNGTAKKTK